MLYELEELKKLYPDAKNDKKEYEDIEEIIQDNKDNIIFIKLPLFDTYIEIKNHTDLLNNFVFMNWDDEKALENVGFFLFFKNTAQSLGTKKHITDYVAINNFYQWAYKQGYNDGLKSKVR